MWMLVICLFTLVVILLSQWLQKWLNPKGNGRLPRASMACQPLERRSSIFSMVLFSLNFRYGSVFKTRLLNQYIFKEEGKSVYCSYTESALKVMGEQSLLAYHGVFHKYLKNLTLSMIVPESLKEVLLHEMDAITRKYLHSCSSYASFDVKDESANLQSFSDGIISFPLNIPGTAFHVCLRGCENVVKVINERKSSKKPYHDFLDFLLERGTIIVDLVFVLLFASYKTTFETITLVMKFLSDHLSIVVELMKEHEEIMKNRGNKNRELHGLGNIILGIFRVTKDIEMKVMVCPSAVHLNPAKYNDPLAFDPWPWEGQELHAGSKNFIAFGGGSRLCAGAHFATVQVSVFLHCLVTKYRNNKTFYCFKWKKKPLGGEIIQKAGLVFSHLLHIQISVKYK
ncbi:hypothetical protein PVL29_020046 [Vitis rotundifolia]|uniref:Cytochrome P450 n=1 Tax=Vitis rotundifolia TaxID=103349 RepID=A0AA38Z2J6_VITRO|nr:hypothetical protein PVL29_020046 [Vitis rotundifolia]